ncbi:MAG: tetratricopeptide repeat protein [Patescibacteria group bacterium]
MLKHAFAFLLVAAGVMSGGTAHADTATFIVLPFERSDQTSRRDYAPALTALLAEHLQCRRQLRPLHGPNLVADAGKRAGISASSGEADIAATAISMGAAWIFVGDFAGSDEHLLLTLRVFDSLGRLRAEAMRIGDRNDLAFMIHEAGVEVAYQADLSRHDDVCPQPDPLDPYAMILFGRGVRDLTGFEGKKSDPESAAAWLEKAVLVDPRFTSARRYLAYADELAGRPRTAQRRYLAVLSARPTDLWALYGLASVEFALGRFAAADEHAAAALRLLPGNADLRFIRGRALWRLGRDGEAERELLGVVDARPDHLAARRALAEIYDARGATAQLVAALEAIAALDAKDTAVRFRLAVAYVLAGDLPKAIAVYERVIADHPDRVSAYKFLGDLRRMRGELDPAVAAYAAGQRRAPWDPRFFVGIAGVLHLKSDHAGAAKVFAALAQKQPGFQRLADRNIAVLAWHLGNRSVAAAMIEKLARQNPEPADLYLRAVLRSLRGQNAEALADAAAAAEADPTNTSYAAARMAIQAAIDAKRNAELVPELDEPYWNVLRYRLSVDRYFLAAAEFAVARDLHDRSYTSDLAGLSERRTSGKKGCPTAEIAALYAGAIRMIAVTGSLKRELAWRHDAILEHHRWGETDGLPVEYAAKIRKVHDILGRVDRDQRETETIFRRSLAAEVATGGCKHQVMLVAAASAASPDQAAEVGQSRVRTYPPRPAPTVENRGAETVVGDDLASVTVFFVIDNSQCGRLLKVMVDGTELGSVAKNVSKTFEVRGGRHSVCVTPSSDANACLAPTTNRQSYIHEGWTLTIHCS